MSDIRVKIEGASSISDAFEIVQKQFPYSAEKVLKKEMRNIQKDLKTRVNEEAKGHHYGGSQNPLSESFRSGRVIKSGNSYTGAVLSKAPHYHLYEEGHDLISHNRKSKKGRGKPGTGKKIGEVAGRKTVARYMAQRSEYAELIGQELLNEILKDAGLE